MLKKTLLATAATILLSVPAMAADIVEAPVEVPSWTGFYLGAGVGAGWTSFDSGAKACNDFIDECIKLNDPEFDFLGLDHLFNGDSDTSLRGIVQAGFDWEMTPGFVLGVFTDYDFGSANGSNKQFEDFFDDGVFQRENKLSYGIDNIWTIGGRLGYATENALFYGLLGYSDADAQAKIRIGCFESECIAVAKADNSTNGVTYGGGVEFKGWLFDGASTALEYRYTDLDDTSRKVYFDDFDFVKAHVGQNVQQVLLTFKWRFDGM